MKFLVFVLLLTSCYVDSPPPPVPTPTPKPIPVPIRDPYCGDGICDKWNGENDWWCVDCGYDPLIGGPRDGGYCGDGICFGDESILSCCSDCCPILFNSDLDINDPGWIDPMFDY